MVDIHIQWLREQREIKIVSKKRTDGVDGLQFFCPFCNKNHLHGKGFGLRFPHCNNKGFLHQYELVPTNTPGAWVFSRNMAVMVQ